MKIRSRGLPVRLHRSSVLPISDLASNFLCAVALAFGLSACQPNSSNPSSPSSTPGAPSSPTLEGTISGGGGNGCEGRVVESYARRIEALTEYRLYIQPTLRVMARGGDPLAAYLKWAAHEKTWFFVPCELQRLSAEQTGLAFARSAEQLALHGENGIFIDVKKYEQKSSRDRASLLLHEMVMGARWLMKKSPEDQCRALTTTDSRLCADPDLMAIARSSGRPVAERIQMDADDHDAIRSLTAFLSSRGRSLTNAELRQTRRRLGFHFPWDEAVSSLTSDDVMRAMNRTRLSRGPMNLQLAPSSVPHPIFRGQTAQCAVLPWSPSPGYHLVRVQFALGLDSSRPEAFNEIRQMFPGFETVSGVCEKALTAPADFDASSPCEKTRFTVPNSDQEILLRDEQFEARGVLRDGRLVDEVLVSPDLDQRSDLRRTGVRVNQVRIQISREVEPQLLTIRFEPKRVMMGAGSLTTSGSAGPTSDASDSWELIDDQQMPGFECRPAARP
jgi:hypothetical protein